MVRLGKLYVPTILLALVLPANAQGDLNVKQMVTITITSLGETRNYRLVAASTAEKIGKHGRIMINDA